MLKLTAKRTEKFYLPQDEAGDTWVEILYLKPGEVDDIESKSNSIIGKQKGEDFHTEIDFKLNEKLKTYVLKSVKDWGGFLTLKGKPLPCNDANKLKVMQEYDWFKDQVAEFREELREVVEGEEEELEKN